MSSQDLKQLGLKVTLPRMKVLEILQEHQQQHLSAEDIYKILLRADEEIGLATIYRVLTQFEAAGLVRRLQFENGQALFELNRGKHHDHIVCTKCGEIVEFYDEVIEQRQNEVMKKMGFTLTQHNLVLYGDCTNQAFHNCPKQNAGRRAKDTNSKDEGQKGSKNVSLVSDSTT